MNVDKAVWNMDMNHIVNISKKVYFKENCYKNKIQRHIYSKATMLNVSDIRMMIGNQDETILIENVDGVSIRQLSLSLFNGIISE